MGQSTGSTVLNLDEDFSAYLHNLAMSSLQMTPEVQYHIAHVGDNRSADIIAAQSIMLVVAYIAVGLRLLARRVSRAGMGYDDWMILIALVSNT